MGRINIEKYILKNSDLTEEELEKLIIKEGVANDVEYEFHSEKDDDCIVIEY